MKEILKSLGCDSSDDEEDLDVEPPRSAKRHKNAGSTTRNTTSHGTVIAPEGMKMMDENEWCFG